MSDVIDAQEYFPDISPNKVRQGLGLLVSGNTQSATVVLAIDPVSLRRKRTERQHLTLCEIGRRFFGQLGSTERGVKIELALTRYRASGWYRDRKLRTNPHCDEDLDFWLWQYVDLNKNPIGAKHISAILKENSET